MNQNSQKFPITLISVVVVAILAAVIYYVNFLPFGLNTHNELIFGKENDTLGVFKLLPSSAWGSRDVEQSGTTYRTIEGSAQITYQPKYVLTKSKISLTIEGDDVAAYTDTVPFNPELFNKWQHNWDLSTRIPTEFKGNTYLFDGCTYFDGKSIMYYENTKDLFESGTFSLYVEWQPNEVLDYQQIVGHFNWELFQSKNFVIFQVGKMAGTTSTTFYSIRAPIDQTFFNKKHKILIQYKPDSTNGYIEMFLDDKFVERRNIGSARIDPQYGDNNLTFGWSSHNYQQNPRFKGCLYRVAYSQDLAITPTKELSYTSNTPEALFNIVGKGKIYKASITVEKQ